MGNLRAFRGVEVRAVEWKLGSRLRHLRRRDLDRREC
jgi:hypothetical protein